MPAIVAPTGPQWPPLRSRRVMARAEGSPGRTRLATSTSSGGQRLAVDDRIAPLVERDGLGQQLCAVAVGVTRDGVDEDADHASRPRGPRSGTGAATAGSSAGTAAPSACARDVGREDVQRAADQVHRAIGMPAGAPAVDLAQSAVEPRQQVRRRPARRPAGSGRRRWRAARRRTGRTGRRSGPPSSARSRADSVSPQASGPRTTMMPTPAVAPMARSEQRGVRRREVRRADPGAAVPTDQERLGRPGRDGPVCDVDQSGVPRSISTTPGCSTAPESVTSDVPGSSTSPWARKASGPVRAIIATWASVSALCTSAPDVRCAGRCPCPVGTTGSDSPGIDPTHQRRLLAGNEAVGGPDQGLGAPGRSRASTRSASARATAAATCRVPRARRPTSPRCAAGRGQELRAVEDQVGRPDEQQLVLVAGRFALHGVDDDGAAGPAGMRRPRA